MLSVIEKLKENNKGSTQLETKCFYPLEIHCLSLNFLIRNNIKFWFICEAILSYGFFVCLFLIVYDPPNHISNLWSRNMKQVFPDPFV